ncbi:MAG: cupredoxin domain-containing protein, partial [Thermoleophilia bacterium]|nr:cupredoxin domain-containing protein [Thermoleophilia bacterium]
MKKLLLTGATVALLIASTTALAKTVGIEITATGFRPAEITIESGDSVSWKNSDSVPHDVVVEKTPCKLTLQPAQTSSCTFTAPGTLAYAEPNRNEAAFKGKITVTPPVARSVTLTSSRPHAIFGGAVVLSGTASSRKAGETV